MKLKQEASLDSTRGCNAFWTTVVFLLLAGVHASPLFAQDVTLSAPHLNFGNQNVGEPGATKSTLFKNKSDTPLKITSIATSAGFAFAGSTCPLSPDAVEAGATCTISVTFTPFTAGKIAGILTIVHTGGSSPETADLSGKASIKGLVSLEITPVNPTASWGETTQLTATGTLKDGSTLNLTHAVTWTSSSTAVATISNAFGQQGTVTTVGHGTTTIQASLDSFAATTNVTVIASLISIAIDPSNPSVSLGKTQQFSATGTYSDNSTQSLPLVNWSSSSPSVATIDSAGISTGVAIGQTTISAASGSMIGSTSFEVKSPFTPTGSMNTARGFQTATLLHNGKVLSAGGGGPSRATAELYDPIAGTFSLTGSMSVARWGHTATLSNNGKVLIVGGSNAAFVSAATAELYDPATGTFTPTGSMSVARTDLAATLLDNGKILVTGGTAGIGIATTQASAELYDPVTGLFTPTGSMIGGRVRHTMTLLNNGLVLVTGGSGATAALANLNTSELYNPATGAFAATGSLTVGRSEHTATLLNNGRVLITGGATAIAELYDPATGTFTPAGSMTSVRQYSTAALLNNGKVLIVGGGINIFGGPNLASAELYDSSSQTFTSLGNMNSVRAWFPSATVLTNGQVLIAGGFNGSAYTASAELYEPATRTPPDLISITVTPATPNVPLGTTQRFVAIGLFSDSTTQQLQSVTWSSYSTPVAEISNDAGNRGTAVAIATGATTITATAGGVSGFATLTVH